MWLDFIPICEALIDEGVNAHFSSPEGSSRSPQSFSQKVAASSLMFGAPAPSSYQLGCFSLSKSMRSSTLASKSDLMVLTRPEQSPEVLADLVQALWRTLE